MYFYRFAALFVVCVLLTGCKAMMYHPFGYLTQTSNVEPQAAFDQAALQNGVRPGHAIVRGQAFSKTVGGDVKYGAGNDVLLLPSTDYANQCIRILATATSDCGTKLKPYVRVVQADGEGRFEFNGVAPGSYIVTTIITWGVPTGYGIRQTGGPVTAIANVVNDTDEVTVSVH